MNQTQKHIDDFFRNTESSYTPDFSLQEIHWQQLQVKLKVSPPASPSTINIWFRPLGMLFMAGIIIAISFKVFFSKHLTPVLVTTVHDTIMPTRPVKPAIIKDKTEVVKVKTTSRSRAAHKAFINKKRKKAPGYSILNSWDTVRHEVPKAAVYLGMDSIKIPETNSSIFFIKTNNRYPSITNALERRNTKLRIRHSNKTHSAIPAQIMYEPGQIEISQAGRDSNLPVIDTVQKKPSRPARIRATRKPIIYNTELFIFLIQH